GAKSMTWKKMLAQIGLFDVLDINVSGEDGTSLGSAIIGGVAAGIFSSIEDGVKSIKTQGRVSFNRDESKAYEDAYRTYVKLYPSLKHVF
ncbi:MAG: xylulokinase, partial [Acetivibrionales bacterium]